MRLNRIASCSHSLFFGHDLIQKVCNFSGSCPSFVGIGRAAAATMAVLVDLTRSSSCARLTAHPSSLHPTPYPRWGEMDPGDAVDGRPLTQIDWETDKPAIVCPA